LETRVQQPIETARPAPAAIAEDIRIEPAMPRPAMVVAAPAEPTLAPEPTLVPEQSFIAPLPERAVVRPTRMPDVKELPLPVQNQIAVSRGAQAVPQPPASADQRRMSLMHRLASVGFGRKDEEAAEAAAPVARQAPPSPVAPSAAHAEYMRRPAQAPSRPAQGQLDPHGRAQPNRSSEEDHLEIPAFLRRQAN
jgi:cell division protein FtsZ